MRGQARGRRFEKGRRCPQRCRGGTAQHVVISNRRQLRLASHPPNSPSHQPCDGQKLVEDDAKVAFAGDEHPVGALTEYGPDEPFGNGVHLRRLRRGCERGDAGRAEYCVERGGELGVAVPDKVAEAVLGGFHVGGEVPGQLSSPGGGRVPGDAEKVDLARGVLDDEGAKCGSGYSNSFTICAHAMSKTQACSRDSAECTRTSASWSRRHTMTDAWSITRRTLRPSDRTSRSCTA